MVTISSFVACFRDRVSDGSSCWVGGAPALGYVKVNISNTWYGRTWANNHNRGGEPLCSVTHPQLGMAGLRPSTSCFTYTHSPWGQNLNLKSRIKSSVKDSIQSESNPQSNFVQNSEFSESNPQLQSLQSGTPITNNQAASLGRSRRSR